ncbi:carbohydrate kinase family protein [Cetobacterium sp. 8H]|uniref:carbohydrate kinase family protein n=1 Tax=Cetobacterium sp. 8H TaxID=2759681 RepID=UPI00163B6423|nr:PfkB family carbohydrate kinase [Cetobacterium sp. 8H]MBC2851621.1 carbohydrate kinase family protein [Cetobacterium sp. 8H]
MKKILCVGHSACDITYLTKEYPLENRKYKVDETKMMGGGPTGNASYLLGKYKQEVSYITTLGTDPYGVSIVSELESVGVDLKNSLIRSGYNTPCSMIITNTSTGSRTILNHRNKNIIPEDYKIEYDKKPEIILFDGHEIELARLALKEFPESLTVLDAGSYKEETVELASKVDYLICSEDFARDYTKVESLTPENYSQVFSQMESLNGKNVVITLGEKGCIYRKNGELYNHPAFQTKAIDTTGAGDIFHGAFVYALSNNFDFIKTIKFSSVCASLSVEKIGGRESIPELNDIYKRMEKWESTDFKI